MSDEEPSPPDWLVEAAHVEEMELQLLVVAGALAPLLVAEAHRQAAAAGLPLLVAMRRVYGAFVSDRLHFE